MKDAKGHGSNARSVRAGSYEGKPVFHGIMSNGQKVKNSAGNPIAYTDAERAVAGANFMETGRFSMPSRPGTQSEFPDKVRQNYAESPHAQGLATSHSQYQGISAETKAWQAFHASRTTSGPHYLDPHDPRGRRKS